MSFPNPSNLQIRIGFEANEGRGDSPSLTDMRVRSESLGGNFPTLPNDDIIADAETPEPLPTKVDPDGDFNIHWSAEDHPKLLANFQGFGKNPVTLVSGAYRHKYAPKETDITFRTLQAEISRDNGRPEVYTGCYVGGIDMSLAAEGLMEGKASLVIPRYHFWKAAAVSAGTPPITTVWLRGLANYANLDADVYVKIITAVSGGILQIAAKVGSGGTYGSTIDVTVDTWTNLTAGADNAQIGSDELPVQIYFSSLATYSASTPDVLIFSALRTVWTQSLPVSSPSNSISASIYVDGSSTPYRLSELGLSATRPAIKDGIIGGRFTDTILPFGKRVTTVKVKRRSIDRTLTNRLIHAKYISLRMDVRGPLIGATVYRRMLSAICMNLIPAGKTPSVGGPAQFDDDITFTAHPSSDSTYPSGVTFEAVNSQSVTQ